MTHAFRNFSTLLAAAQANQPEAFRVLYENHAPLVSGYVNSQGTRDADDLVSETFLSVYRGIASFSGSEKDFRSWLLTIAHRRITDARRKNTRQLHVVTLGHESQPGHPTAAPAETDALVNMAGDLSLKLLSDLSEDQRAVIALRVIADLSLEETAQILGKNVGSVKALQHRGLETLRRLHRTGRIQITPTDDYQDDD